ncbi:MAG: hypothetical protein COA99_06225 [Moraxellaceae bacterium]|nr:MAG: hypothetical protein COA99_06225 [Moraxellaceae bacterium]
MQVGSWTLDLSQTENSQCLLTGTKNTMHDGQGDTPIYLEVSLKHITLHTKSNIDTSYADTGVFIGNQPIATIETLYTPTSVRFSSQYATLITSMKKHPTLEIELGFWPSWPVTHPYHASIVNESFESAYLALEKCNALL